MTIDVVIATCNGEKYIENQLKSVMNQTIKPTRIVISDANSSDKTISICEDILHKQTIVNYEIYKHKKQLNVTENYNFGLHASDADYVFMCDQDDVWLKDKIEITLNAMIKYNACLGFTNARVVDSSLKPSCLSLWEQIGFTSELEHVVFDSTSEILLDTLIQKNVVTGMCTCISKDLLAIAMDIPNTTIHDAWLAIVASCMGKVVAINKECVLYRQHKNNQIGAKKNFKKTIIKINIYKQNIINRIKTIQIFLGRYDANLQQNVKVKLNNYIQFLLERISYLDNNKVANFKSYKKKYEIYCDKNQYKSIFIKDWIFRNLISKIL